MCPEILEQEGLAEALRIFCAKVSGIAPVAVRFQLVGTLPPLEKEFELNVNRMVQELVQNVIKHARAQKALVQVVAKAHWLCITVEDDGIGLPENWSKSGKGMGLRALSKRVGLMQGTVQVDNNDGTSIYLEFKLPDHKKQHNDQDSVNR